MTTRGEWSQRETPRRNKVGTVKFPIAAILRYFQVGEEGRARVVEEEQRRDDGGKGYAWQRAMSISIGAKKERFTTEYCPTGKDGDSRCVARFPRSAIFASEEEVPNKPRLFVIGKPWTPSKGQNVRKWISRRGGEDSERQRHTAAA
ncbi:hypothetical protein KM043_005960 [Ampulex compressa]|nr:hypothetical protein KM043_005960 [Ampulex compressa]